VRARVAWGLFALTLICAVAETAVLASFRSLLSQRTVLEGWPVITVATVVGAFLGALVISRYPGHRIGWLLLVGQFGTALGLLAGNYALHELTVDPSGPETWAHRAGWLGLLLGAPYALSVVSALFLLAPDGHLLSPRWRPVMWACAGGLSLFTLGALLTDPADIDMVTNKDIGTLPTAVSIAATFVIFGVLTAGAVSLVRRLRASEGDTRLQLRWIATSAAALAGSVLLLLVAAAILALMGKSANPDTNRSLALALNLPLYLAYASLPIATGVAVLRYRLYDIDLIINRAVVLGAGTIFVAFGYVTVVVLLADAIGGWGGGFWPSLATTAVVALAFQPMRSRVLRLADRLAYGSRAAPYDALAEFSRRVGQSPEPQRLLPAVAQAARLSVAAGEVEVHLEVPGSPGVTAVSPPRDGSTGASQRGVQPPDIAIAVRDDAGHLGTIAATMPPGRTLRAHELQLLHDISEQAALALRNARLEAELAAHVADLDRRTDELRASRRRLIEAGDAERRRLESAISRQVLPSLLELPAALDQVRARGASEFAGKPLDRLVEKSNEALEALRELTRGVFPTLLARSGLGPALTAYVSRSGCSCGLLLDRSLGERRFSARVEAAAYFCASEALHEASGALVVRLSVQDAHLLVEVQGSPRDGMDLQAMVDRVEALGGSLSLDECADDAAWGDTLVVRIPVEVPAVTAVLQKSS